MLRHKFGAKRTEFGGRTYDSKKEAEYAAQLALEQRSGAVLFWLEQVPFRLQGGVVYRLDFMVFESSGDVRCIEVKGMRTKEFNIKMKMMAEAYPLVEIEVV